MLIVKGERSKATLANILMLQTRSICFQYYDAAPIVWDSVIVDDTKYSLDDLIECIIEVVKEETKGLYDYLIVYTNEKEKNLEKLISWLNSYYKGDVAASYADVIVMCKE